MDSRVFVLLVTWVLSMATHAEFTPAGARQVFDDASANLRTGMFERGDYVFVPVHWEITGKIKLDRKAEMVALQTSLKKYLSSATGLNESKIQFAFTNVQSTVVRTAVEKRTRKSVVAFDAVPLRSECERIKKENTPKTFWQMLFGW